MNENRVIAMFGQKGCGKTALAAEMVDRCYLAGVRVIAIAPVGLRGFFDRPVLQGVPVIRQADAGRFGRLAGRSCLVLPESDAAAEMAIQFAWESQAVRSKSAVLLIDEIHQYCDCRRPFAELVRIIRYARHRRLSIVGTSQRPAQVHKDFVGNADTVVCFRVVEPNDLRYISQATGLDPERLRSLPERKFLRVVR